MKTNSTLNKAFPIVAAALSNKLDVQVSVGGRQASTDGRVIHLPAYNGEDSHYKDVAWGFLAHEAGHVRFTDRAPFELTASEPVRKTLLNIVEDIRIEKLMQTIYPGTIRTLGNTVRTMIETGGFSAPGQDEHPAAVLVTFMLYRLRCDVLGQGLLAGYADVAEKYLEQTFLQGLVTRLMGLLSLVPSLRSTRESLGLTDRILRMLEEERDQAQHNPPGQDNGEEGDSAMSNLEPHDQDGDADGQAPSAPDLSSTGESNPETAVQPANGNEPIDEDTTGDEADAADDKAASGSQGSAHQRQVLDAVLSAHDDDLPEDLYDAVKSFLGGADRRDYDDSVVIPAGIKRTYPGDEGETLYRKVVPESRQIRAALNGFVQSHLHRKLRYKASGNRLDGRKAYRIAVGNPNVFVHLDKKRTPDTVFHILLDGSSSMEAKLAGGHTMISVATDAAMALALALEGISGINPAVTRFPCERDGTSVIRLLDHGQTLRTQVSAFKPVANGGTPMHSALWYAAAAVVAAKASRKIILVLTDGEPDDLRLTQAVIGRCERAGIEMVGVGIAHNTAHLFKRSTVISDVTDLRGQLLTLGRAILLAA